MFTLTKLLNAALLLSTIAITGATLGIGSADAETLVPSGKGAVTPAQDWADSLIPRHAIGPAGNFDPNGRQITGVSGFAGVEEAGVLITDVPTIL
ncbi:hypothetical protein [Amycolatopsis sp. cmx-4-54]|uniref:hypothetical protein n=1 Tax=Amycolatopsis sp. cmx-4-54 TaxID=2790936 RepID=UPI00397A0323